jgi:thiol-disulfide isomerase/thioredoxin
LGSGAVKAQTTATEPPRENSKQASHPRRPPAKSEEELEVVDLTSRSFGRAISDGNIWLIEFYSPHCKHCVDFAPTYADIARHYHSDDSKKIKVGRVNGEVERALVSRFGIYAYPSFYLIDGWSVYMFEQPRIKKILMNFTEGGYKDSDPVPWLHSPMGPMGILQGGLLTGGLILSDFFQWSHKTFGLSPVVSGFLLFGSIFMSCFFLLVLLALAIPPKHKQD